MLLLNTRKRGVKKKMANNISRHGVLKIKNMFITYSICISSDNKNTYISLECAKGITKNSMISELNKLVNSGIKDIAEYTNVINSYGFKYITKKYDDDTFIYVCNKEYMECFNNIANINDNTYTDLN